ncbi:MAG: hypothetical protein ACXWXZ_12540, partial [Candidatus Binatia bacterium]
MKWTEDSLHGFVSTVETHTGQNQYEIAVGDWQGMDCVHPAESEIGRNEPSPALPQPNGNEFLTTKCFMILRTPTEHENGWHSQNMIPFNSSFPRTRESRFVLRRISLDTRFRGYDG